MFDILRRVIAKEKAELTELLVSGNMKDQYDRICGSLITLEQVLIFMADIEKKLATAGETEDEGDDA